MPVAAQSDALIDPVCGTPVGLDSPYRKTHGGALFCFCSTRCLDCFVLDPAHFLAVAAARSRGQEAGRGPAAGTGPGAAPPTDSFPTVTEATLQLSNASDAMTVPLYDSVARQPLEPRMRTLPDSLVRPLPDSLIRPLPELPAKMPPGGRKPPTTPATLSAVLRGASPSGLFAGLALWRERRFVRRISRELLKLYRSMVAANPGLRGRELYRRIVIARLHTDRDSAETLIDQAEDSFAAWPVRRAVNFCDVVHFIAVSEFLATHGDSPWIHANVRQEIASQIPPDL